MEKQTFESYPLEKKHIDFYQTNGYIQLDNVLSPEEVLELSGLTDEMNQLIEKDLPPLAERNAYQQVFLQIVNVWLKDPRFKKFSHHPRLAEIAAKLIGTERVRIWHDHLMTKMAGKDGRATEWHQDFPYWPMKQPGPMSIWIPMQDVDWENGCMHFVPKSHTWNLNEVILLDKQDEQKQDIFDAVKDKDILEKQRVYCPLKAGSVTFHNGLTFHFAGKNYGNAPRKVLSVIYMPENEIYDGKAHVVSDGLGLEPGKTFDHPHFPVLNL